MFEPRAESPQLDVCLGELRTDQHGRLLVLGGLGESRSVVPDNPVGFLNADSSYANNDYWHDDVSDGRVHAEATLKNGPKLEVRGDAWVIVAPPKYAPHAEVLTTLWDCAEYSAGVRWPERYPPPRAISFTRDVYPIIRRVSEYQWFNQYAYAQHGSGMTYDLLESTRFKSLHTKGGPGDRRSPARLPATPAAAPGDGGADRQDGARRAHRPSRHTLRVDELHAADERRRRLGHPQHEGQRAGETRRRAASTSPSMP